jgi:hypothetical protein
MSEITQDLNTVIASAVNARIEAQVAEALAGDAMIGKYVAAALGQTVEIPSRNGYGKDKVTFLKAVLDKATQAATKAAVERVIGEETEAIEKAVRKELRANINTLAVQLVGSVNEAVEKAYGVKVELIYPGR